MIGKGDYVKTMIRAYRNIHEKFKVLNLVSDMEKGIVIAKLELLSGRSVDIFELENDSIRREREYCDDVLWLESRSKTRKTRNLKQTKYRQSS